MPSTTGRPTCFESCASVIGVCVPSATRKSSAADARPELALERLEHQRHRHRPRAVGNEDEHAPAVDRQPRQALSRDARRCRRPAGSRRRRRGRRRVAPAPPADASCARLERYAGAVGLSRPRSARPVRWRIHSTRKSARPLICAVSLRLRAIRLRLAVVAISRRVSSTLPRKRTTDSADQRTCGPVVIHA